MPGLKDRRRRRQYDAAFARYAPDHVAEPVELLTEHALDAWLDAAHHTHSWWAIPAGIRPQARRRYVERVSA